MRDNRRRLQKVGEYMISQKDLARQYVKLYECVRQYIWPYETVEDLAELEIAAYNLFPDLEDVRRKFDKFYRDIELECLEDEELNKQVKAFKAIIESEDPVYSKLTKVNEVETYENTED